MIQVVNQDEIVNKIDNNIDFIATVISGWHLSVLYSFLLGHSTDMKKGIIIIRPQKILLNEEKYRVTNDKIKSIEGFKIDYYYCRNSSETYLNTFLNYVKLFKKNRTKGKKIYLLSPMKIDHLLMSMYAKSKYNRNANYVILDEGIGNYENKIRFYKGQNGNYLNICKYLLVLYTFQVLFIPKSKISKYLLYNKTKNELIVNKNVSNKMKNYYVENPFKNDEGYVQQQILLVKDYIINNNDNSNSEFFEMENEMYSLIIEYLYNNYNLQIYVKMHPNDSNHSFNLLLEQKKIIVIEKNLDAEEIVSVLSPTLVVGGFSTAFFSIVNIFNIKGLNYLEIYDKIKLTKEYKLKAKLLMQYFFRNEKIVFIKKSNIKPLETKSVEY